MTSFVLRMPVCLRGSRWVIQVFFCCRRRMRDARKRDENEWERGRITRGDGEIKFHLALKNWLHKTNDFSEESFHHRVAVGPCAVIRLRARDRLFVFITRRAALNAWDDLFFSFRFSACLARSKCKVIVTPVWRFELKQEWFIWKRYVLLKAINEALRDAGPREVCWSSCCYTPFIITDWWRELGCGLDNDPHYTSPYDAGRGLPHHMPLLSQIGRIIL